jgi:hypothetical protein
MMAAALEANVVDLFAEAEARWQEHTRLTTEWNAATTALLTG